jgi:BioD-like phosphotransacetylase family protein
MERLIISSLRQSAGKTSLIVGLAKALNMKAGYMKPFGERFLYKKKRLWDYDAALITQIFNLGDNPEDMSIGFHHLQLFYALDENAINAKLVDTFNRLSNNKEIVFVEEGKDISYGTSVHLDAKAVTKVLDGQLLLVVSGDENTIIDDIGFIANGMTIDRAHFKGVVINKVTNMQDFADSYLPIIKKMGVPILGIIPYCPELAYFSVEYLADRIFAKVLTGEAGLQHQIRNTVVGSIGADVAVKSSLFEDRHKALIVSGDRSDLILNAIEYRFAAVILTNNIIPSSTIISKAENGGVPLLLVPSDTIETARQIDGIEPLTTSNDSGKIAIIEQMVQKHVDVQLIVKTA